MSHEIHADYSQTFLFPPCLEDWVAADHPARFIREFVEALDLTALGFAERAERGGAAAVCERSAVEGVVVRVPGAHAGDAGIGEGVQRAPVAAVADGLKAPDHNTLWRFWRENRKALRAGISSGREGGGGAGVDRHDLSRRGWDEDSGGGVAADGGASGGFGEGAGAGGRGVGEDGSGDRSGGTGAGGRLPVAGGIAGEGEFAGERSWSRWGRCARRSARTCTRRSRRRG